MKHYQSIFFYLCTLLMLASCGRQQPFAITEDTIGTFTQISLRNNLTGEYVSIVPAFGGTINQVALQKGGVVTELVDGCKDYTCLTGEGKITFKGSKLFPFPNRIKDGRYTFDEKAYQLPLNFPNEGHAIHGLVLTEKFEVISKQTDTGKAVLELEYLFDGKKEGYPFKGRLLLSYELSKTGFVCKTTVINEDKVPMPVGDGWHPYFKLGGKVDGLSLKLPSDSSFEVDDRMIPTMKTTAVKGFNQTKVIGAEKFDTGFKVNTGTAIARTEITDTEKNLKLVVWQETGPGKYNFLQVYTPPHRNTIAIEPMTCAADAFNNRAGLTILKPGESTSFSFGVNLE